jgi:hypothetical protein
MPSPTRADTRSIGLITIVPAALSASDSVDCSCIGREVLVKVRVLLGVI